VYLTARHRRIGRWSALLAVYAFVLNALLASTLLAATSASKSLSGFELCTALADGSGPTADHDDRAVKRAAIHCQLCLQHAAEPALPAPSHALLPIPVVFTAVEPPAYPDPTCAQQPAFDHLARGPPSLS
jgi:hypothetical protein